MNEFFNAVYLNNTIREYLVVTAIIVVVVFIKRYLAQSIASLVFGALKQRWQDVDKATFRKLISRPLGFFLAVLTTVIALDKLNFPDVLDFSIYHITFKDLVRTIGTFLLIYSFFSFLVKSIDFITLIIRNKYINVESAADHQLFFFFKDLIKVMIGSVGFLMMLKYCFNYDVKGLITGLSIVGAAIALALKESLENLIASFIIFFDKPFALGDVVKVGTNTGTIEKIGLRSTRIRSEAKTYITIPNKQMVDTVVDNLSDRTQRRADLKLEIAAGTAPDKLEALLAAFRKILSRPDIQNFNLAATELTAAAIIITADYYTAPIAVAAFNQVRQDVILNMLSAIATTGVQTAGAVTDIKIVEAAKD